MSEISIRKKDDLLRVVRKKDHHKRSAGKLKFDLGQGKETLNLLGTPTRVGVSRTFVFTIFSKIGECQRSFKTPEFAFTLSSTHQCQKK